MSRISSMKRILPVLALAALVACDGSRAESGSVELVPTASALEAPALDETSEFDETSDLDEAPVCEADIAAAPATETQEATLLRRGKVSTNVVVQRVAGDHALQDLGHSLLSENRSFAIPMYRPLIKLEPPAPVLRTYLLSTESRAQRWPRRSLFELDRPAVDRDPKPPITPVVPASVRLVQTPSWDPMSVIPALMYPNTPLSGLVVWNLRGGGFASATTSPVEAAAHDPLDGEGPLLPNQGRIERGIDTLGQPNTVMLDVRPDTFELERQNLDHLSAGYPPALVFTIGHVGPLGSLILDAITDPQRQAERENRSLRRQATRAAKQERR